MRWRKKRVSLFKAAAITDERIQHIETCVKTLEQLITHMDERTKQMQEHLKAVEGLSMHGNGLLQEIAEQLKTVRALAEVTDERAQHIESRDFTIEERAAHIEERLQIMDQDKWKELVDRMTHMEEGLRELAVQESGGGILQISFQKKE